MEIIDDFTKWEYYDWTGTAREMRPWSSSYREISPFILPSRDAAGNCLPGYEPVKWVSRSFLVSAKAYPIDIRFRLVIYDTQGKYLTEEYVHTDHMQQRIIALRGKYSFDLEEWQDAPALAPPQGRWVRIARNEQADE